MDIKHIASLARVELTKKEEEKMKDEMSSILSYIDQLSKVDTDKVEPLYQTTGLVNSLREDTHRSDFEVGEDLHKKLVGQAPDKQERFVRVKSVLNK